jgi:hypothetical protein
VGFVVSNVALKQVFSEYFGLTHQFSFHRLLHIYHLSLGSGTIGQLMADVPSRLSLTSPPRNLKKILFLTRFGNCIPSSNAKHSIGPSIFFKSSQTLLSLESVVYFLLWVDDLMICIAYVPSISASTFRYCESYSLPQVAAECFHIEQGLILLL